MLNKTNDTKLLKAKSDIDSLKTKSGKELIEELGIKSSIDENLMKNSDLRGRCNISKMKSSHNRYNRNSQLRNNISTVQEDEQEDSKSDSSSDESVLCETSENHSIENSMMLTKNNLNKFSMKNERADFQNSLVGTLYKSIIPKTNVQSYVSAQTATKMSCGKMIMLSDKLSFIGSSKSLIWRPSSALGSAISSLDGNTSKNYIENTNHCKINQSVTDYTLGSSILERFKNTYNRFINT